MVVMRYSNIKKYFKEKNNIAVMRKLRKLSYKKYLKCIEYLNKKEHITYADWKELLTEDELKEFNWLSSADRIQRDLKDKPQKKWSFSDLQYFKASDF